MTEITLPTDGLDESIAMLKEGDTCEITATVKVISKTDSEMKLELSDIAKSEGYEDEGGEEDTAEDMAEGEAEDSGEDGDMEEEGGPGPMRHGKGKGMGIIIMLGKPKK